MPPRCQPPTRVLLACNKTCDAMQCDANSFGAYLWCVWVFAVCTHLLSRSVTCVSSHATCGFLRNVSLNLAMRPLFVVRHANGHYVNTVWTKARPTIRATSDDECGACGAVIHVPDCLACNCRQSVNSGMIDRGMFGYASLWFSTQIQPNNSINASM